MVQDKRIIYTHTSGDTHVVVPSPEWKGTMQELHDLLMSRGDITASDIPEIVDAAHIPTDRTFRNAWKRGEQSMKVGVDMVKAKDITHSKRRAKRDAEMAPFDEIIMKQIPGKNANQAEAERQKIRDKHAALQVEIDGCTLPENLKAIIDREKL